MAMKNHKGFNAWRSRVAVLPGLLTLAFVVIPAFASVPAKGTQILWDRYGIPHLVADTRLRLALNVSEELALEALAYRLGGRSGERAEVRL